MYYKNLFNINLHHNYFLNEGTKSYTSFTDAEKKARLQQYDIKDYVAIEPTPLTKHILKNYRLLFKQHTQGFTVLVNTTPKEIDGEEEFCSIISLDDELTLTFGLWATDTYFQNYTQVTAKDNNKLYLFTNEVPDTDAGSLTNIFDGDGIIDVSYLLSGEGSRKLIHTIESSSAFLTSKIERFSLANIDADTIENAEEKAVINSYIQTLKKKGLIGFVQLKVKVADAAKSLLGFDGDDQFVLDSSTDFTLSFKNRRTFWRYHKPSEDAVYTTLAKKPLTKNGYIEIEEDDLSPEPDEGGHYPNPSIELIVKEENNYYSDIFI